ncbi:MAG: cytochrome c maturation protein CcmE [Anaerolineae bacterium]|nr:cytochrome c maturation protein CcmE [Anaerolineae bacterium]
MAQATWEKSNAAAEQLQRGQTANRLKFIIGGVLILAAVIYLIVSGTATGARYFMTIDELVQNPDYVGQSVRVSGAVIGDSIQYDSETLTINFTVSNIPAEFENLALALHESVNNPDATRLAVVVTNQVKPDLLKDEAQAILTGKMGEDGVFYASELLLKCPSRYEEAAPDQAIAESEA